MAYRRDTSRRAPAPRRLVAALWGAALVAGLAPGARAMPPLKSPRMDCRRLPKRLFEPFRIPDRFDGRSPLRWWRKAHFTQSCRRLNLCYSRLGSFRADCDATFEQDSQQACRAAYDRPGEEVALQRCLLAVSRWNLALRDNQGGAYRDARDAARHLEEAGPRKVPRRYRKWETEDRPRPKNWPPAEHDRDYPEP